MLTPKRSAPTMASWTLAPFPTHTRMRGGDSETEARVDAFKQELAKLGWTEGRSIAFEEHWTTDNMDRVRAEAAALVASNPDVIVTYGGRVVPVFMRLTRSIPMVLPSASDPVDATTVSTTPCME